ncbi:hypothetical protein CMI45_00365 [Candidatus Pacearchaeota archaeon]|jgi:hypothetical protein|nr:hypothetical protein [Candidatus Pacearchaeota archaeon]|tara:strand:- start:2172 stop:2393 length:222 start_codon:yes stop_codon:yes gene_type:complete
MNGDRRRFKDDYEGEGTIGKSYRSLILGGEVYLVKGYDNRKKDSSGVEVIVGIKGRPLLFNVNVKECMFDGRV